MKKIFLQFNHPSFANNKMLDTMDTNNLKACWFSMKEQLAGLGYELCTADDRPLEDCEGIIFANADSLCLPPSLKTRIINMIKKIAGKKINPPYPTRRLYEEAIAAGLRNKMVLLAWEPRTVLPSNYSKKIWDKFDHVLVWDDDILEKNDPKFSRFYVPMEGNKVLDKPVPFNEKKLLVNISINKYSSYKNELYSARRKTSAYFTDRYPDDFDLFGLRWNQPVTFWQKLLPFTVKHYSTYRGHAKEKLKTLSQYKFNLVYENTSDGRGYVCDKIYTSFHARSVPIYWGAPNVQDYIDHNTYIDRRDFKSDEELAAFLTEMDEKTYNDYLEAAAMFMKSDRYARFSPEGFSKPFIEVLGLDKK